MAVAASSDDFALFTLTPTLTSMADCSDADEVAAIFDAMFHGVSLQSLLLDHAPQTQPIVSDYPAPSPSPQLPPLGFSDQCPLSHSFEDSDSSSGFPISSRSIALKLPKQELLCTAGEPVDTAHQPPPLLLQSTGIALPASGSRGAAGNHLRRGCDAHISKPNPASRRAAASRNNLLARQRRRRISEKMTCLKKLMPWNRKMDTATLLEEAHKYILFLEAQVSALYSMPINADDRPPLLYHRAYQVDNLSNADCFIGCGGSEPYLDGQQTLQALVDSSVSQTMLYSPGQYVVSEEQLDMAETTRMAQQHLQHGTMSFDSSPPIWNFY